MKFSRLQKREDSVQQSLLLSMSGAGAPIFFAFIKLFILGYVCNRRELDVFMHTLPGWRCGPLSGSPNFFQSLLALPRMPTTSLPQGISRLVWTNLSAQHA